MANKWQIIWLALIVTAAFFAGGWFFSRASRRDINREIEALYQKDGASVGIFDRVLPEDITAAEQVVQEQLYAAEADLPEEVAAYQADGRSLPSQLMLTERKDIAGVAAKQIANDSVAAQEPVAQATVAKPVVQLNGNEVAALAPQAISVVEDDALPSHRTMIVAPVRMLLVRNLDEYKAFKQRARGGYPSLDFNKQMLVVLESDSNFPDNVFEIVSADKQDGALIVSYRVNMLGLDKKINSHSVLPVDKTQLPIQLKQVL